jgi:hypothetical protein
VLVVSAEDGLFHAVSQAVADDPRFVMAVDTLHCDGTAAPLTNIYPVEPVTAEWEDWETDDSSMPDPSTMSQLIFECRSPEWVAEVGRLIAAGVEAPVWFVDSSDVAWPADRVDPSRASLA